MKMETSITNIIYPAFALFAFVCFGLAPTVQAACMQGCSGANTFLGDDALLNNTSGFNNTAIGIVALFSNTAGIANTAIGASVLSNNTTGSLNTATGVDTLFSNISGSGNTATGIDALSSNTAGNCNTATGGGALLYNTAGSDNTATGCDTLVSNTTGNRNTAAGYLALYHNSTGTRNTADGNRALFNNSTGSGNIAVGALAGDSIEGSNNIDIGNPGNRNDSATIRIGTTGTQTSTFIAGISGVTVADGIGVIVGADGRLGTVVSSARFKDKIQPMDNASQAILALKPVTFHYKKELDPDGIPQFGLVAEQVEKVSPELLARDKDGKPYTVRYEAVNAMLLNEFLKEHKVFIEEQRKVTEQEATIKQLKAELQATEARQQKQIESLTAGLQKVSAQLEVNKSASPTVADNQ